MMTEQTMLSDLAIPPGEYLQEVLDDMAISQADLARRMGRPAQAVNEIIKGEKAITAETALQLEQVVGVPASFWNHLEADYRLILAKAAEAKKVVEEHSMARLYPYADLAKLNLVKPTRKIAEKVYELRRFFGVASLFIIPDVNQYKPAFRQCENSKISNESLVAWLRAGSTIADKRTVAACDKTKLRSSLDKIRSLTLESEPSKWVASLKEILAECGVVLVLIPHFKKTYTTGATYWLGKDKAVIMMSLRGSWSDIFWFSLFHEIAHILLHDKRVTFLENTDNHADYERQEEEANEFARNQLIPEASYQAFIAKGVITQSAVKTFADAISIFPGIVTGRLQHDKKLAYSNNWYRCRYRW